MPYKNTGEDIFTSKKKKEPFKLKIKGQSITFRLAKEGYFFEGLHFSKDSDGKFKVTHCPRVESNEYCETCDKFFKARDVKDEVGMRTFKPTINVFYMILDRADSTLKVLQTTAGKQKEIAGLIAEWDLAGKGISDFDLKLTRTEEAGANYYSLKQVDSSMSKPLTNDEKDELEKAKIISLADFMDGNDDLSSVLEGITDEI